MESIDMDDEDDFLEESADKEIEEDATEEDSEREDMDFPESTEDFPESDLPELECVPLLGGEFFPDCGHMVTIHDELEHEVCTIVPEGHCYRFWMGNVENTYYNRPNEFPRHQVDLTAYSMSRYPVTVREYNACVEAEICTFPNEAHCFQSNRGLNQTFSPNYANLSKLDHPVNCIPLMKAERFCNWLGGKLPTEARFEFAAAGPMSGNQDLKYFPWGNDTDECHANIFGEDPFSETSPVGFFDGRLKTREEGGWIFGPEEYQTCDDRSFFGVHDLTHNCIEMVFDGPSNYNDWPEHSINPIIDGFCEGIQVRGSGWSYKEIVHARVYNRREFCMVTSEEWQLTSMRDDIGFVDIGFRCVF